jgi:Flp pilus assembly protein TadG
MHLLRRAPLAKARNRLVGDQTGVAVVEFALISPLLITLLMGGYDASQAMIAWRRTSAAAQQIVKIATEVSIQADQTTSLTPTQAQQATSTIFAVVPGLSAGGNFSVTLSGVVFTAGPPNVTSQIANPCLSTTTNCTASVAWSVAYSNGQNVTRPCGTVRQVPPNTAASLSTLPTLNVSAQYLTSLVVADVTTTFTPFFGKFIGSFSITSTAMLVPRIGAATQFVEYDVSNVSGDNNVCAGFEGKPAS